MIDFLRKRKGLFLFFLYVTPLCVFLQNLNFATTNAYAAFYILLTAGLLLMKGFCKNNTKSLLLTFFFVIMICLMGISAEWLAVMQTLLLLLYLHTKASEDLYGIDKLSNIILLLGVVCAIFCIVELVNFPFYASLILPLYKPEVGTVIQTLYVSGGMCGTMPQTADAAGIILNSFYVLVVLRGNTISKFWKITIGFLLIVGLFLTAKRAHLFFGLAIWLFSYIITSSNKKRIKNLLIITFTVAISIPILVNVAPKLGEKNVLSEIIFSFQNISTDQEEVMHGRNYLYEMAWKKVEEAPLTGHEWGSFKKTVDYRGGATDVHNVYLQLWAESGIFMLILYVFVLSSLIIKTIKIARFYGALGNKYERVTSLLRFSFCIQGFFILYCFTGNCLYNISFFSMYILAVSIMLAANRKKQLSYT